MRGWSFSWNRQISVLDSLTTSPDPFSRFVIIFNLFSRSTTTIASISLFHILGKNCHLQNCVRVETNSNPCCCLPVRSSLFELSRQFIYKIDTKHVSIAHCACKLASVGGLMWLWTRLQRVMNAVLHCSDVELDCKEEVGYLGTGPYLIQSSDKVY